MRTRQTKPGHGVSEGVFVLIPAVASTPPSPEASFLNDCSGFPHSPQFTPPPPPGCLTTAAAVQECLPYNVTHISKCDRALQVCAKSRWVHAGLCLRSLCLSEPGSASVPCWSVHVRLPSLTYSWRPAFPWRGWLHVHWWQTTPWRGGGLIRMAPTLA